MKRLINISTIFLCAFFGIVLQIHAQDEAGPETASDILRFSTAQPAGSTRMQSIGGAQNALGGDISNASGNPAGLGFFNKSEFSITPAISFISSKSDFLGNTTNDLYGNLNINNLGFVFARPKAAISPGKWRGGSFAITFNTFNNFNSRFKYSGVNPSNSLTDYYREVAYKRNINYNQLGNEVNDNGEYLSWEALAYGTYLIDVADADTAPTEYINFIADESVRQYESLTTKGSQSQWNFAYGGNYNDKLYFGASIGLASFRYEENRIYKETVLTNNDGYDDLNNFTLNHDVTTKGSGINLNVGIIYRANDYIRFGGSVQTPTYYYSVQTQDDGNIIAIYNNFEYDPGTILENEQGRLETFINKYRFTTPWKLSGGLAFFFNKNGFISADLDYVAYGGMRGYSADNYLQFNEVNNIFKNEYKSAVNLRIGGEYRIDKFRIRAGYANYGSAVDQPEASNNSTKAIQYASVGAGFRWDKLYLDFGVVQTLPRKFNYYPYLLKDYSEPEAKVTNSRTKAMFTLGFHF
jgi:hypothetical protein